MPVLKSLPLLVLLSSCGNGSGSGDYQSSIDIRSANSCPVDVANAWVYGAMQDYYLFYDQVDRNVDLTQYESPEMLMRALRVAPNDKYSYVTDATTYEAFFNEGETFGYGWNLARDDNDALLFSLIEPNSPLDSAGVQRGEELLAINGIDMDSFYALTSAQRTDIVGSGNSERTLELTIGNSSQSDRQVRVTKSYYTVQTVLNTDVIERNGVKVGYLHFYQFLNTSKVELQQAFSEFNDAGISELVLDMRFNGGGRIAVANELSSRILGTGNTGSVFTTFAHNDKYQANNASIYFQNMSDSLTLNRVFVLQSGNTCSASELIVNSLRPFMEVVTIGSKSCGKPYATAPNKACGKVANALEIELLNANGVGDYFDGIAADCPVSEDVSKPLGDLTEPLLAASLGYIDSGSCGSILASRSRRSNQQLTSEFKPQWQQGNAL